MKPDIAAYLASLNTPSHPPAGQDPTPSPSLAPRADRVRERLSPLKDRLAVVLDKIPDEVKADGIRLDEVWSSCLGRQKSKPTANAVAAAFRELGWKRVRIYPGNDSDPGVTLWFPPLPVVAVKGDKC